MAALKDNDPVTYSRLVKKIYLYAKCVGTVDTGFFKRQSKKWDGKTDILESDDQLIEAVAQLVRDLWRV